MGISAGIIVALLVFTRAIASSCLPFLVAMTVYEVFWMQTACFLVSAVWSDFLGRGLLMTFKKTKAYLITTFVFQYMVTIPLVLLNVFVVPSLFRSAFFLE